MVDDFPDMKPSPGVGNVAAKPQYEDGKPEVEDSRAALVAEYLKRAKRARQRWKPIFDRMEKCQQIAAEGADEKWLTSDNYVVPIINRHINQAVAQLYAKNPKAIATRKKRLMYTLWDGKMDTLTAAMEAANPQPPVDPMTGAPLPLPPELMPQPDPNAVALIQEVADVKSQNEMVDRMAKTFEYLWTYYTSEQSTGFKQQMKALVRRTKVNSVGWAKLAFQRALEKRPEIGAQIDDTTSQIARLESLSAQVQEGDVDETSARLEELRLLLKQLQNKESVVVREGPVYDWPRSNTMYPDEGCLHLKTLYGASLLIHEMTMRPETVREVYGVDICGSYTEFKPEDGKDETKSAQPDGADHEKALARIYEIQDKTNGQFLTVCEGYPDFLKEPAEPDVKIERFFTGFPLVFNETENAKCIYPPSDVWLLRHPQSEYNRAREALREHRIAAAPQYSSAKGALDPKDKAALSGGVAHSVIDVKLPPGVQLKDVVQRIEKANIDPNLYEVEQVYSDVQRSVGVQEANIGGTGDGTATESTIAEQSRSVSLSENIDDLDEFLTELAAGTGQLMLMELTKETVQEIVGPGAVWPDMAMNREEVAKDLVLEIKAGSSGRPNAAAELAKLERGMPYLLQMPGISPDALGRRYAELLDLDVDDLLVEGLPSITALNSMMAKGPTAPGTGDPATDPAQQGGMGGQNAPNPAQRQAGPQPAFPVGNI